MCGSILASVWVNMKSNIEVRVEGKDLYDILATQKSTYNIKYEQGSQKRLRVCTALTYLSSREQGAKEQISMKQMIRDTIVNRIGISRHCLKREENVCIRGGARNFPTGGLTLPTRG